VKVLVADVEEICFELLPDIVEGIALFQAINDGCMLFTLTRRGYKGPKATIPVLLLFGSIDLQFHIMFQVEHWNGGCERVDVTIGTLSKQRTSVYSLYDRYHSCILG
jgi:hypothetical protein